MSILDDAIREHLALKRAHGADESELKKLEDEAFGPPQRPDAEPADPFAEAPTEFLTTPDAEAAGNEGGRRSPNIADLQEPPPPGQAPPAEAEREAPPSEPEQEAEAAGAGDDARHDEPAVEEHPAAEHEAVAPEAPAPERGEPLAETGPNTEERHAIAEQPTQFFDVEAEMTGEGAPAAPEPAFEDEEEDDDFWSEQRLSDELDQALEAPVTDEHEALPPVAAPSEEPEREPEAEHPEHEDHVTDEDDHEATAIHPTVAPQRGEEGGAGEDEEHPSYEPHDGHDDVLEDTPEFLEDAPEDDELWFEQKPPKDFDFDD